MLNKWVERQWGQYIVLEEYPELKIKKLLIEPGKSISYQKHEFRSEDWFILRGLGLATLGEQKFYIGTGSKLTVPAKTWHSIRNLMEQNLEIIEIQYGSACDEEDITRKQQ